MKSLSQNQINDIIKKEYPNADNAILSEKLGIKEQTLRNRASNLKVRKSEEFMKTYYKTLQENRRKKQENNYKNYEMTNIQRNIIVGSLLGDGSLAKYGRSLNAYYRENTGPNQIAYRSWKAEKLSNLDFKANAKGAIRSPSHPIYSDLYDLFYPKGIKIISPEALNMLDHPIGLACLFMDDGSLTTSASVGVNTATITSDISLYSQSFTERENILLLNYIKDTFKINFRLANIPSGHGYHLKLSKNNEIRKFLHIIRPYVNEIPCMKYKVDIDKKLKDTKTRYQEKNPDKTVKIARKETLDNTYSKKDEEKIIDMINKGLTYKEIAKNLGRSYYGLYDKVKRMEI